MYADVRCNKTSQTYIQNIFRYVKAVDYFFCLLLMYNDVKQHKIKFLRANFKINKKHYFVWFFKSIKCKKKHLNN